VARLLVLKSEKIREGEKKGAGKEKGKLTKTGEAP